MNEIGDGEKIPVQEISVPNIVEKRIIPIISRYEEILSIDAKSIFPEYQLAKIPQKDLDRNRNNLGKLKELLTEFVQDPKKFKVAVKSESHENGNRYSLKLKRPGDPDRLPTKESKAVTQISFYVVLHEPQETREERLMAEGLGRAADEALSQMKKKAPREISVMMSTVSVYRDEEIGRTRIGFNSGVVISSSLQEGLQSQGVIFSGATPYYTEPLSEKAITKEECLALRNYVTDFFGE